MHIKKAEIAPSLFLFLFSLTYVRPEMVALYFFGYVVACDRSLNVVIVHFPCYGIDCIPRHYETRSAVSMLSLASYV